MEDSHTYHTYGDAVCRLTVIGGLEALNVRPHVLPVRVTASISDQTLRQPVNGIESALLQLKEGGDARLLPLYYTF